MAISEGYFNSIKAWLIQKYGAAASDEQSLVHGWHERHVTWALPSTLIVLTLGVFPGELLERSNVMLTYTETNKQARDTL